MFEESHINEWVRRAEYAVRGEILLRAMELDRVIHSGEELPPGHPTRLVYCNIGNPQSLGQQPLTFNRQVLSLVVNPSLLSSIRGLAEKPAVLDTLFSPGAVERAQEYVSSIGAGVGAYSDSQGYLAVRKHVAEFISERDGVPSYPQDIFLSDGASASVRLAMQVLLRSAHSPQDAIMVPIPQYPLYSALASLFNAELVGYYLDEEAGWGLQISELERAVAAAKEKGIVVRALVVINPDNPTGQSLPREDMEGVVRFCAQHGLVLMADEVYQENVYARKEGERFLSFKKVVHDLSSPEGLVIARARRQHADASGTPEEEADRINQLMLISFHSISKGFLGECGLRGGYMELHHIPTLIRDQMYKLASITLCPNTIGQVGVGLMVCPPRVGTPERQLYDQERRAILGSLGRRANDLAAGLNRIEGISCQVPQGAMYAFPRIHLSKRAIAAAEAAGQKPDTFYCLRLLNATGVVVVPGSGFKQKEGTFHFRTTFLPPEDQMSAVIHSMAQFHASFAAEFQDE